MTDSREKDQSPSTPYLSVGNVVGGRYRVDGLLGRGGMGVVYAATHQLTQRRVAVKVLDADPSELPAQRERFLSEARTAAAVRHPNIVDILDMGTHLGSPFLVMELLEGSTLDPVLADRRPVSYADCLSWLLPIIGALATLHEAGIVHRDVKPSNIFLYRAGPHVIVPKLLDFGLARAVGDARLTRSGVVIGTPLYMAPEHAAGAQVGPLADVWSTGVVLYECMTGALPYSSTDRSVVAAQVLAGHVRPVRQARPDLPEPLAEAIDGALQRELGRRHASMRALAQALVIGACTSGIALPEQLSPVGLPEYAAWCREGRRRAQERPAEPTHEISAPQDTGEPLAAPVRSRLWFAFGLISGMLVLGWLLIAPRTDPTAPAERNEGAGDGPAQARPADDAAAGPGAPTVMQMAAGAVDAGAQPLEAKSDASASSALKPGSAATQQEAPASAKSESARARRTSSGDGARRKAKAPRPAAAAEVETEWK
jgi:serine/threonine-protein kinase